MDWDEKIDLAELGKARESYQLCSVDEGRAHDSKQPLGRTVSTNPAAPGGASPRTHPKRGWTSQLYIWEVACWCALSSVIARSPPDYSIPLTIGSAWLIWRPNIRRRTPPAMKHRGDGKPTSQLKTWWFLTPYQGLGAGQKAGVHLPIACRTPSHR